VQHALARGHKVVYLADREDLDAFVDGLAARDEEIGSAQRSGQFRVPQALDVFAPTPAANRRDDSRRDTRRRNSRRSGRFRRVACQRAASRRRRARAAHEHETLRRAGIL